MFRRRRWTAVRPSGERVLIAALLVLMAGWNTGVNIFYVVFGGAAGFFVASFVLSRMNLRQLQGRVEFPHAVHRGDRLPVAVHLRNTSAWSPAVSVRIEQEGASGGYVLRAPSSQEAVVTLSRPMEHRGVHVLPPVGAVSGFPFGFVERRKTFPVGQEVVVYPRVRAVRPVALDRATGGGNVPQRIVGEGGEYFSLREYVPGDDPRRIAWRASARRGTLLVRELSIETVRSVMCVLDTRMQPAVVDFAQHFEDAVELAASLAVTLINRQYQVGLATGAGVVPLGEGLAHAVAVLDALARVAPGEEDALTQAHRVLGGTPARFLGISPDPVAWGARQQGLWIVDPREVVYA